MISERPNALNLLDDLGRRIGLRLDRRLGHFDPVMENILLKARLHFDWPVTLYRSLVWPFTPLAGFRLLTKGV